jgi:hypothetical protein
LGDVRGCLAAGSRAASGSARAVSAARSAGHHQGGQLPSGLASRSVRRPGSPSATSTILVRPDAPATSVTAPRRTPNAAATAASAASVALPSTARALTRTIRAPACPPPTPGRAEPGRTRIVIRTYQVCGQSRDVPDDHGSEQIPASRDGRSSPISVRSHPDHAGRASGRAELRAMLFVHVYASVGIKRLGICSGRPADHDRGQFASDNDQNCPRS